MSDPSAIVFTPDEFEEAVARAAQLVAQVHRRRLVVSGFIAGLLSTAIIALPSLYVVAKANCNSITKLGTAQEATFDEAVAARTAFLNQSKDRFGLTEEQFRKLQKRQDESQHKQLRAIRDVAHTDCRYL